ncbi:unnamed protein product [Ectocarpus fasciculatus]
MWVELIGHRTSRDRKALATGDRFQRRHIIRIAANIQTDGPVAGRFSRSTYPSDVSYTLSPPRSVLHGLGLSNGRLPNRGHTFTCKKREDSLPGRKERGCDARRKEQSRPPPTRPRLQVKGHAEPTARRRSRHVHAQSA